MAEWSWVSSERSRAPHAEGPAPPPRPLRLAPRSARRSDVSAGIRAAPSAPTQAGRATPSPSPSLRRQDVAALRRRRGLALALHTLDVDSRKEVATTKLEGAPAQVLVLGDGRVAVTLRDKNRVQVLEPEADASKSLASLCSVEVAVEPFGLALTPDDKTIVVTSAYGQRLTAFDAGSMAQKFDVKLPREPRAVLVDDAGERAFVAHVVGAKMSVVDLNTDKHDVREVDLRVKRVVNTASARNTSDKLRSGCQGFALAKSVEVDDKPGPAAGPGPDRRREAARRRVRITVPAGEEACVAESFAPMVTVEPGDPNVRSPAYYGQQLRRRRQGGARSSA